MIDLEFARKVQNVRVTADQLVCLTPCFLFSVCLVCDQNGPATADIYDGHNTRGHKVMGLVHVITAGFAGAGGVDFRAFNPPIFFQQGLYVDVGSNVSEVTVQFISHKE